MKAAGDFVDLAAELTAGVKNGHYRFEGGLAGSGMSVEGNSAPVVPHCDPAVGRDVDPNPGAEARHRFVDAVVDHLDYEVVQATLVGAADVHAGTAPHSLQPFEDLDIAGGILLFG